jgi:hypothetical protein
MDLTVAIWGGRWGEERTVTKEPGTRRAGAGTRQEGAGTVGAPS